MSVTMAIALMLLPPPPPAPDPAKVAEAVLIWRDHPLRAEALSLLASGAMRQRIEYMLRTARVRPGSRQWLAKSRLLDDYFWPHLNAALADSERPFLECLAGRYGWMSIEEIRALRQFLATPAGAHFWEVSGLAEKDAGQCAVTLFGYYMDRVEDGAWRLIGARRPPPPPFVD